MLDSSNGQRLTLFALASFIVLATMSGVITTIYSQVLIVGARAAVAVLLAVQVILLLGCYGIRKQSILALGFFLILLSHGVLLGALNGSIGIGSVNLVQDLLVVAFGVVAFGFVNEESGIQDKMATFFSFYALAVLLFTFLIGGLSLNFPPQFLFEFSAAELGRETEQTYSLGVSRFFGFAAVVTAFCVSHVWRSRAFVVMGVGLSLVYILLSFVGGGRGEALVASGLMLMLFFRSKFGIAGVGVFGVGLSLILLPAIAELQDDFLFLGRLARLLEGDLSSRDVLLKLAVDLIAGDVLCMVSGCGVGFFQHHYGLPFGMHPHNFLLEGVITFGFPVMFIFASAVAFGVRRYYLALGRLDFFLILYIYHGLVGLKSGYLFGSWIVFVMSIYFSSFLLVKVKAGAD